jgi:hypothetical protein
VWPPSAAKCRAILYCARRTEQGAQTSRE